MEHKYNKGSEWRKWDLHIHTPDSLFHNYNTGELIDVWDKFIIDIESLPKEIKVVGINDYLFIDGYRRILEEKSKGRMSNIELFLPVIELRIAKFGGNKQFKRVNFHIIFSNDITPDVIQGQFLNALSAKYVLTHGINKDWWGGVIDKENLQKLGEKIIESIPINERINYDSPIKEGFNNLNLDENQIFEALHNYHGFEGKFITAIGKTEWDDFKWNDNSISEKKTIINNVDIVFTAAETVEKFRKAKEKLREQNVNDLLLDCSDAHYNIDSDNKDRLGNCNTWIKADATFEGLKQIISEPEERVRIQSSNPNEEKLLYNIIEKIRFIDNSSQSRFTTHEIGFNPNLNAIIGGKSSGKSLLMHLIAGAVGNRADSKNYSELLNNIDIEVFYADNTDEKIKPEDSRIVEFLPQLHIEDIVRNKTELNKSKSEKTRHFNTFIEDLIKQDELIKSLFVAHKETIKLASAKINENITAWLAFDKDLTQAKKELQPLGDKTAIKGEIIRIDGQITTLTQNAGLTEDELEQYTQLTTANKNISEEISRLESEKAELARLLNYATNDILQHIKQSIRFETNCSTSLELYNKFILEIPDVIQPKINSFIAEVKLKGRAVVAKIEESQKLITENKKLLEPLLSKNKIQLELKMLETSLAVEKAKLATIEEKEAQIATIKVQRDVVEFITEYANIIDSYAKLKDGINERVATIWGESNANLTLVANSIFDSSIFVGSIGAPINLKSQLETQFSNCGFNATTYIHLKETHIQNIDNIIKRCIADENRFNNFKGEGNIEELLRAILKDCFYIDYDIKKGSDSLQNMSEGKKGIVVLQLYLSLSKADCPILIDQPEDNLDNRTVYRELNDYIKHSKKKRQIIMVSHNANLVVNTDAENVIIANQAGEDGKENKEFRFEYINGSLENTSPLDDTQKGVLYQQGIREHVCEILEGGTDAFRKREEKYQIRKQL